MNNTQSILSKLWLPALGLILLITAIICRPLLPIDETRYMGVAWEMSLHNGWLDPLTKNFEPYHHKPPLLFWLINMFWSIFGISRWVGTLPVVLGSITCIVLTGYLAKILARDNPTSPLHQTQKIWMMMAACFPFMIYGTLVMFDFLLCMFVLLSVILTVRYAQQRRKIDIVLLGLCLGLGVLTKGPVAYLYVLPAYLLAPFWNADLKRLGAWYGSCLLAIVISALPVLFWLIPVLKQSDDHFAFWLVWNQTAGRITGNFGEAHVRPFYFYLPFLPLFMMPWILFPSFWRYLKILKSTLSKNMELRFILCLFVPVFVAFSLISGKQIHYLVPLVPALILLLVYGLNHVPITSIIKVTIGIVVLFVGGQIIAKHTMFEKYDLLPVVQVIEKNADKNIAYVSNYHAEFSFLARLTKPIEDISLEDMPKWFDKNPQGLAIVRCKEIEEVKDYKLLLDMPYRGRHLAVISR